MWGRSGLQAGESLSLGPQELGPAAPSGAGAGTLQTGASGLPSASPASCLRGKCSWITLMEGRERELQVIPGFLWRFSF